MMITVRSEKKRAFISVLEISNVKREYDNYQSLIVFDFDLLTYEQVKVTC